MGDNEKSTEKVEKVEKKVNPLISRALGKASPFKSIEVPKGKSGFVVVKFLEDFGSRKKDETETYHKSTAEALIHKGYAELVKHLDKYVPKTAVK